MARETRSSEKAKQDEDNDAKGRQISTRLSDGSGSRGQEMSGPRRSSRNTPSEKPMVSTAGTRKSERLEKRASTPPPVSRKSDRIERKNEPSPLRRSERGKSISSPSSAGSRMSGKSSGSPETKRKDEQNKKSLEQLVKETQKGGKRRTGHLSSYRALFRPQRKKSEASASPEATRRANEQPGLSEIDDQPEQSHSNRPIQKDSTAGEANVSIDADVLDVSKTSSTASGSADDTEKDKVDNAQMKETMVSGLLAVKTDLEKEDGYSPVKRKRNTEQVEYDTPVADATKNCLIVDAVTSSSSECKNSGHPETCRCLKRQRVDDNPMEQGLCSCNTKLNQGFDCATDNEDRGETEGAVTTGNRENNGECIQQNISHGCRSDSSRFIEYWVPVPLSNIQLEQYCATLMSNSLSLCSSSKNDPVGALCNTLINVRKCCDHPYAVDQSLQPLLNKDLKEVEYLDVGIKASGKLQLLDAMLMEIKSRGSKAVVLFQTIGGFGRDIIGDILDDFVRQRFGPTSYERVERDLLVSRKQTAVNKFNKESGRFVLLLETRACNPSIKLSSVDALIFFDSNWSPLYDLRALQKIKVESKFGKTKIFRLYSACTVEEKILILAKQHKIVDSSPQNISPSTTHVLLMWGASFLYDKLDQFHNCPDSGTSTLFEQSLLENVVNEFSAILSQDDGDKDKSKSSYIRKANLNQGIYSIDFQLFGEQKVELSDEDRPNLFWTKLLEGKSPKWKYCSLSSQRNRKRVQYFNNSERSSEVDNAEVAKKRKKMASDGTGPPSCHDETVVSGKGNKGHNIPELPEDMLVGKDYLRGLHESQKSLHVSLKQEIAKLCNVLHLSEDIVEMVEKFLEYIMHNHNVNREPATALQAFQISVCWVSASLLKQKINRKASLALAKEHLNFECKKEEVDYIYSMLCCLKSLFLTRTRHIKLECLPEDSQLSTKAMGENNQDTKLSWTTHQQKDNIEVEDQSQGLQLSAQRDLTKSIRDIRKKCHKQMTKLLEKQKEESGDINRQYEEKRIELEGKKRLEAAVIRMYGNKQIIADKLKKLDSEFAKKFEELKCQVDQRLHNLEAGHVATRNKVTQKEARWIERVRSWAEVKFVNPSFGNHNAPAPCSGSISSKTSENAPDRIVAGSDPTDTAISCAEPNAMVSEGAQTTGLKGSSSAGSHDQENMVAVGPSEAHNIIGTASSGDTELNVPGIVASNSDPEEMLQESCPSEQCTCDGAIPPYGQSILIEPETLTSTGFRENNVVLDPALCEDQVPDGVASAAPNEDISLGVAETVQPGASLENTASAHPPSGGKQVPASTNVISGPGTGEENDRTSDVASDTAVSLDSQVGGSCSLNQESPIEELPESDTPLMRPASASEHDYSAVSNQATQDACSLPSSLAGNQVGNAATIGMQNASQAVDHPPSELDQSNCEAATEIAVLPSSSIDASAGHYLATNNRVQQPSNEDRLVGQNAQTTMHQPESRVEVGCESLMGVSGDSRANGSVGALTINVSADNSVSNNCIAQSGVPALPQSPFSSCNDPLQNELERICRETERAIKVQPGASPENTASAHPPSGGEQVPASTNEISGPGTGEENDRTSDVASDTAVGLDLMVGGSCSLDQESPIEELPESDTPLMLPASASEHDHSAVSNQATQDACSLPSSLAGNQVGNAATIGTGMQNASRAVDHPPSEPDQSNCEADTEIAALPSSSIDASAGHDLAANNRIRQPSNEDRLVGQNAQTTMHQPESRVEVGCQPLTGVSGDSRANGSDGTSTINVSADNSVSNNCIAQRGVPALPQLPFPPCNDPFQNELERIRRETERAIKVQPVGSLENTASAHLPSGGEQAPASTSEISGPGTGEENDRTSDAASDTAVGLDPQVGGSCSLNQESPIEELPESDTPLMQPASASEHDHSAVSNQATQDACSLPSSLAGNQVGNAATIGMQNASRAVDHPPSEPDQSNCEAETEIAVLPSSSIDASVGHDLATNNRIRQPSNEDRLVGQNAQTMMHQPESRVEVGCQPLMGVSGDSRANGSVGASTINVSADNSVSNNRIAQSGVPALPQLSFPSCNDPLQNELERIHRETERAIKIHEERTLQLKSELEEEIAQIRRKYESKLNDVDREFHAKKEELETNHSYVIMNKLLAEVFRSKCTDPKASGAPPGTQRVGNPSFMQHLVQLSQIRAQRPSSVIANPSVSPVTPTPTTASTLPRSMAPTLPASHHPLVSSVTASPSVSPVTPTLTTASSLPRSMAPTLPASHHPLVSSVTASPSVSPVTLTPTTASSLPRSMAPTLPASHHPLVSSVTASPSVSPVILTPTTASSVPRSMAPALPASHHPLGNTPLAQTRPSSSGIRAPAPHLQAFRSSVSVSTNSHSPPPCRSLSQPASSNPPAASPSFTQYLPRAPMPTYESGLYNTIHRPETTALSNLSLSAVELLMDVSSRAGVDANPCSSSLPSTNVYMGVRVQPQPGLSNGLQANAVDASGNSDNVVCLSDDD